MIRGPSRGLGTFRCRCRWILLFPLLTTLLLLFAQLNPSQASSVVAERDQSTPAGNYISSKADSGSDTPPTVSIFHQVQIPINMVAGIGGSSSSSGVSQHHHSRFHHHHHQQQQQQQQQQHHQQQQQQQQQQVAPLVAHGYGGYKPAAPSKESSSGTTEEGSILRLLSKNNLYIQSFPNGTVSATGHDSSFYSVLKQSAVGFGRIYIRGIASRLYLCINECGRLYGSEHLEQDCILRDQMEGNWYNTYTSIKHSTAEKSLYMAFNSNTGSPCRLRLKSEITSDGRSIVALGSNEKYALFFPVRNISLPDGMNLTSLIQLNKRIPFVKNSVKPTGCAPRCSKLSDQSIKETSSNRAGSKEKSKRKNKCSCLSSETPAQGGGNVERCRRPRQCRQNAGQQHTQKKNHGESSSSNIATGSGWKQLKRPERLREKESRNQKRVTTENSASDVNLLSAESRLSPINRLEMDHSPVKWMVESESESSQSSGQNEKKTTLTTTHQDRNPQRNRNKLKTRRGKKTSTAEDRSSPADTVSNPSNSKASNGGRQDRTLRFPHRKSDSRLIRHRYRKIRAHPELAEQLDAMS